MINKNITAAQAEGAIEIIARQVIGAITRNIDELGETGDDSHVGIELKEPITVHVLNLMHDWEEVITKRVYHKRNINSFVENLDPKQADYPILFDRLPIMDLVAILKQTEPV